jgi:RNA ligase (TIGR02306 family)
MTEQIRKLASIRKIDAINPIEGADAIECATVGGWKIVVKKGEFSVGDLAVYCEIDSWMPHSLAPFLSKGQHPRVFEGVEGERLKTIKLRGQLSQGLLLPRYVALDKVGEIHEGMDVTELLGILKWEKAIPAQLAGVCKGAFPTQIPKTDQERCQNLAKEITSAIEERTKFEVTEKLEGSSMTVYRMQGEFGVCSRNMNLKETEGNSFWDVARANDIEAKMIAIDEFWDFAIQGELVGPGIQGNIYKLIKPEFYVFDVYNIQTGEYLSPAARRDLIERMGLKHVPVLVVEVWSIDALGITDIPQLLSFAEGKSVFTNTEREGVVFKEVNGGFTFKAISNKYLLGEK